MRWTALSILLLAGVAFAGDDRTPLADSEVPAAARDALAREHPAAKILGGWATPSGVELRFELGESLGVATVSSGRIEREETVVALETLDEATRHALDAKRGPVPVEQVVKTQTPAGTMFEAFLWSEKDARLVTLGPRGVLEDAPLDGDGALHACSAGVRELLEARKKGDSAKEDAIRKKLALALRRADGVIRVGSRRALVEKLCGPAYGKGGRDPGDEWMYPSHARDNFYVLHFRGGLVEDKHFRLIYDLEGGR